MKTRKLMTLVLLTALTITALFLTGCSKDSPTAPDPAPIPRDNDPVGPAGAFISGTIRTDPGSSLDLTNARVAVYDSPESFYADAFTAQAAVSHAGGNNWSFRVGPLNPGNYYLDVWKDFNNTGRIDDGDFYGAYLTNAGYLQPIPVLENQTASVNFQVSMSKSIMGFKDK
ncbi:hypothetical protein KJ682_04195 [bacterium]|nr:hypothetical protein [bacterium]